MHDDSGSKANVQELEHPGHLPPSIKSNALKMGDRGIPVFPCNPEKEPYTRHGFKDATTDPCKITAWWKRWPEANLAIPTGEASGLLVVDLDTYKPGAMTVEEFEDKYGTISHTTTVRSGNGGLQYYFVYPNGLEIRNSAGLLGKHVDVRGEGGYALAPPSVTTGRYEWTNKAPAAPVPPKLLAALSKKLKHYGAVAKSKSLGTGRFNLDDIEPIPEGRRNMTLASVAGYLHDGTRDLAQLTGDLLAVNDARCTPPLEADEVRSVAKSIYNLEPCKKGRRFAPPKPEVVGILGDILKNWWQADWRGIGGKSDRDILLAYILAAMDSGTILPNGGILVDISHHQAAARARKSSSTAYNAHKRLKVAGWCRGGGNGPDRREDQPEGIVLLPNPKQRKPEHPLPSSPAMDGVFDFASLPTACRGRHSAPGLVRLASAGRIACIDHMERLGDSPERTIADALGLKRVYDLRKRYLEPLEERGIVERSGQRKSYRWRLADDWQEALERVFAEEEELERQLYSGLTSDERQTQRGEESRERWRNRDKTCAGRAPSDSEFGRRRAGQIWRQDGEVERVQVAARLRRPDNAAPPVENVEKRKRERREEDELQREYDRKRERCEARLKRFFQPSYAQNSNETSKEEAS